MAATHVAEAGGVGTCIYLNNHPPMGPLPIEHGPRLQELALGGAGERTEAALVSGSQLAGRLAQLQQLGQLAAARQAQVARLAPATDCASLP